MSRSVSSQDSSSSCTSTSSSATMFTRVDSQETMEPKKKSKWSRIFRNPFKRKKGQKKGKMNSKTEQADDNTEKQIAKATASPVSNCVLNNGKDKQIKGEGDNDGRMQDNSDNNFERAEDDSVPQERTSSSIDKSAGEVFGLTQRNHSEAIKIQESIDLDNAELSRHSSEELFKPISDRPTPTAKPRRRSRPLTTLCRQTGLRNSASSVSVNQREGHEACSNRAHYLVVEVVYHGRSLEAVEKELIQTKVAEIVDDLLMKPVSAPNRPFYLCNNSTTDSKEIHLLPPCYPLSSCCNEERYESTPNRKLMNSSNPLFHNSATKSCIPANNFNQHLADTQYVNKRELQPSEPIDYVKYPDLRPAYVNQPKEPISENASDCKQTNSSDRKRFSDRYPYDEVNDGSFMNLMKYMNKRTPTPAPICSPIPSQRHNIQRHRPFQEQSSFHPSGVRPSQSGFKSPNSYASSIKTDSPYNTPACTPLSRYPGPVESSTMCFYHACETSPALDQRGCDLFACPLNATAEMKMSHTSLTYKTGTPLIPHSSNNSISLTPLHQNASMHETSNRSSSKKWRQRGTPTEHDAWWMPREWARERRIGAYGVGWKFKQDEELEREKALELSRNPNVEQIRTSNFIRL